MAVLRLRSLHGESLSLLVSIDFLFVAFLPYSVLYQSLTQTSVFPHSQQRELHTEHIQGFWELMGN